MSIEKVLIVDDEALIRNFLFEALKRKGLEVKTVESGEKAINALKEDSFDLVVTDLKLPGISGMDVLSYVKKSCPQTLVIMITAFGTIENAVEAMKLGAFHYLIKPFSLECLIASIEKAHQHIALIDQNTYLKQQTGLGEYQSTVIAESPVMKQILADIEKVAKTQSNIFIYGETGTGKEVIANLIHASSTRSQEPFIKVNCAAVPESLIESEFFGHEKGAFTGALTKRSGRFELADKGSLLLDEVTEIPLGLQAKLLRVSQEQEFERVGGSKSIKVDVRLISTSNRNIKDAIANKVIREDLFYRLNVIPVHLPPLRNRSEDIIPLAELFITQTCTENHLEKKSLSNDAKRKLLSYSWPGNVRELANIIERAVIMAPDKKISSEQLYLDADEEYAIIGKTLQDVEKQLIIKTLESHKNREQAAEKLGITLKSLRSKLEEYNLV